MYNHDKNISMTSSIIDTNPNSQLTVLLNNSGLSQKDFAKTKNKKQKTEQNKTKTYKSVVHLGTYM